MCYNDKSKIPQKVYDNANKYAPDYELQIYDDEEIIDLIEPEVVHWYKYTGRKESKTYSTFKKNLSNVRKERKKN